jgi:hypothetical protein
MGNLLEQARLGLCTKKHIYLRNTLSIEDFNKTDSISLAFYLSLLNTIPRINARAATPADAEIEINCLQ